MSQLNMQYRLAILIMIFILGMTASVLHSYPGSNIILLTFGGLTASLAIALTHNRRSYFTLFFFSFLILGCWAKVVLHFSLGNAFIEPIGRFDDSAAAWDSAIIIINYSFASLSISYWISNLYPATKNKSKPIPSFLLIGSLATASIFILIVLGLNYYYSILKVGTEPTIKIPPFLYAFISFMVAWGNCILLAGLTYWAIEQRILKPKSIFYILSLEGAITAISMGSRAQMILHISVPFVMYFVKTSSDNWNLIRADWIKVILCSICLFAISLLVVSADRLHSFAQARPVYAVSSTVNESATGSDPGKSLVDHPFGSMPIKPLLSANNIEPPAPWKGMALQLSKLVVDRWIGIEGVLTVSSSSGLGSGLFKKASLEDPREGTKAIYQRMSNSQYQQFENFTFMTIPGPIALLYYSGSILVVILGISALFFVGFGIESLATGWLKNSAISAVTGVGVAYIAVQTNFPKVVIIFILETVIFLGALGTVKWLLVKHCSK